MGDSIRKAFLLKLKPGALDTYIYWHDNIWPDLKQEIARQGITEITLYQIDDLVILHSTVSDPAAWDKLWDTEIHRRWASELMDPLMHYRDDGIIDARELREIWHFEPGAAG
jgi:L-rhamnose mutarotase